MRKNILLSAVLASIIACTVFIKDGLTYPVAALMALSIMGVIRLRQSNILKITRWAKANPKKAQLVIAIVQVVLMAVGIIAGYNFFKLGYVFSDTTVFVFGTIIALGFFSVHFLPKQSTIAIPEEVKKSRLAYMGIALSLFVLTVITGNRLEDIYPDSPVTRFIKSIDRAIFPDDSIPFAALVNATAELDRSEDFDEPLTDDPSTHIIPAALVIYDNETARPSAYSKKEARALLKAEKKAKRLEKIKARWMKRLEKYRLAFAGGATAGSIILIILLIGTLCGGICLMIGGFAGSAALIPLGAVVTAGSIWGLIKIFKSFK